MSQLMEELEADYREFVAHLPDDIGQMSMDAIGARVNGLTEKASKILAELSRESLLSGDGPGSDASTRLSDRTDKEL